MNTRTDITVTVIHNVKLEAEKNEKSVNSYFRVTIYKINKERNKEMKF